MMYLSRLQLNRSRIALGWIANPYRVHQRLMMACDGDDRVLFRIEETDTGTQILVQSRTEPDWAASLGDLSVLAGEPEHKAFQPCLEAGRLYRFRLLANPTVKRDGKRLGLLREEAQRAWLARKLAEAGGELSGCVVVPQGFRHSRKNPKEDDAQTHLAVLFEGVLRVTDPTLVAAAIENGVGPAKGYGFGLLSLAPAQ
jgi:CRISPR system Cascade subunit CasE